MTGRAVRWILSALPGPGQDRGAPRLTIVRHHRVFEDDESPLYRIGVSRRVLDAQLRMLSGAGRPVVTVGEGLRWLARGEPGHRVAMTFDDGYADNVTRALPLLNAHGARATFFLTAGWIEERRAPWWDVLAAAIERSRATRLTARLGERSFDLPLTGPDDRRRALHALLPAFHVSLEERLWRLGAIAEATGVDCVAPCELATWEQATELARSGHEIGAHTLDHPHLDMLPADEQRRQIEGSFDLIARRTGVEPEGLAYPGGAYDGATLSVLEDGPIRWAVTTRAGDNRREAPRFELRRRGLSEGACLGPNGRFSERLARAELEGRFDRLRGVEAST